MITIQMTIDEKLLDKVDKKRKAIKKTRSEFIRESLKFMLEELQTRELENQHKIGYEKNPVNPDEFDVWEDEQVWV
ncbi:MAG TPA: ribbon-helix-helix protein, CopG family [Caldithrix sp.]|nr:ribbon-helix-helix protein, CopG family [Caldithrix sp.]